MADLFDFNFNQLREGQLKGLRVIFDRIIDRRPYTAIVLPTRYGKSDMMRISAVQLHKHGLICAAFALSPGIGLRDQLGSHEKWVACAERYDLPRKAVHRNIEHCEANPIANNECFLSLTIQLVICRIGEFVELTRGLIAKTGKPPVFFIDECHFTSGTLHPGDHGNKWGDAAARLAEAGALIVLMTATEIREDGQPPIGFEYEKVQINDAAKRTLVTAGSEPDLVKVQKFAGKEYEIRLRPDYKLSFKEAWEEENSPLCKVDRLPFDVFLSEANILLDDDGWTDTRISEMSVRQTHQYLSRICRSPIVISEGARRLVQLLSERRLSDPTITAMVFCDVDRQDENGVDEVNRCAKDIRKAIEKTPGGDKFNVIIATSADDNGGSKAKDAHEKIVKFKAGLGGDILIVKQMGGAGLDCPHIKIVLDLSPIRAAPSWIQRIMRAATPYNGHRTCCLITPDDCLAKSNFDRLITAQGGAAKKFEGELVNEYEIECEDREWLNIVGTDHAPFNDNSGYAGEAEQYDDIRSIVETFPVLQLTMTNAQLAVSSRALVEKLQNRKGHVADIQGDLDTCRMATNNTVHEITMKRLRGVYEPGQYGKTIARVWTEVYRRAGTSGPLESITDLKVLKHVETTAIETLRSEG